MAGNLYKNADKRRRVKPGGNQPDILVGVEETTPAVTETAQEPKKEEQVTTTPTVEEKPVQAEPVAVSDVVKMIQSKKKENRDKGAFTYYILKDNNKKLVAAAKKAGMSKSEFLDQLLTEILK